MFPIKSTLEWPHFTWSICRINDVQTPYERFWLEHLLWWKFPCSTSAAGCGEEKDHHFWKVPWLHKQAATPAYALRRKPVDAIMNASNVCSCDAQANTFFSPFLLRMTTQWCTAAIFHELKFNFKHSILSFQNLPEKHSLKDKCTFSWKDFFLETHFSICKRIRNHQHLNINGGFKAASLCGTKWGNLIILTHVRAYMDRAVNHVQQWRKDSQ